MYQNIILIGNPGVGKTTTGKLLAQKLSKQFIDLDAFIMDKCGVDIETIIAFEGENGFRQRESDALAQIINNHDLYNNFVLSLGGGAIVNNVDQIKQSNCTVVRLVADIDVSLKRIAGCQRQRPLLDYDDLKNSYTSSCEYREQFYNHEFLKNH